LNEARPGASAVDYLKSLPLYLLPHHALSRLMFALTRVRTPWFKNAFIRWFSRRFDIDWQEAASPRPQDYEHFNAFFTRRLKDGARPVEGGDDCLVSPADGRVSQLGAVEAGRILQAKGRRFTATALLGGDPERARRFGDGRFMTVYLSPRDYHRVHMPVRGRLLETVYIPGRLFSVAPHTTRVVPGLFARNERLVCLFDTDAGRMALVLVGAIFVAAIETVWAGLVTPPHRRRIEVTDYRDAGIELPRGAELGRFNMGSTVILLFEDQRVAWTDSLAADQPLRTGQRIGRILTPQAG